MFEMTGKGFSVQRRENQEIREIVTFFGLKKNPCPLSP